MSAFVTDGEQRATLAVVRALGQAGIAVTVGSSQSRTLAGSSRYCSRQVIYAPPQERGADFQAQLLKQMREGHHSVLIPMTDITMRLVAQIGNELAPMVRLPIPSEERVDRVQDKREVLLLAKELGIGCPKTFMPRASEELAEVAPTVNYPIVIKPRFSWTIQNGRWASGKVRYAHDPAELVRLYEESNSAIPEPMIQEKIEGEGRGVFLLVWKGELKAAFCHRRLREKPPWGGVSVLRESIPLEQGLVDRSFALLRALEWEGPAMVEFKTDRRDGEPKLMEINGRFWGSLQLASDSGINFPALLYRLADGENVQSQFEYKTGVKSRWLLGDLDHLLIRLKHSQARNGFSHDEPSKMRAILDFLKLYEPDLHYEVFRLRDPKPGWFEWKTYVRDALMSASRRENANAH